MKNSVLLFLSLLILLSCQNKVERDGSASGEKMETEAESPAPEELAPPPPPQTSEEKIPGEESGQESTAPGEIGKKIIKDGNLNVEVDNLSESKQHIDTLLNKFEAYYENEQFNSTNWQSTFDLKIRVPSEHFEAMLNSIESGKGKVISKNITTRDVTEEYVDLSIRLENNREYLKRYNQLLARANSVEDILEIQERTRRIEEEIDSKIGRLKYLDDQVKYSTLNLRLIQHHEMAEGEKVPYGKEVLAAFRNGFNIFLDFLLLLVNMWPFLLLGAILWISRKRIKFFFKRKNP